MATDRSQLWAESGDYRGVPTSIIFKETSKGTPYMEVTFTVQGHPKYVKLWLSEKSQDRTMTLLKDLGFNNDWENPAVTRTTEVQLSCKHNEWQGKWYEEWSFWGERQAAAPIAKTKAAAYAAAFRNVAGVTKPAAPAAPLAPLPKPPAASPPAPLTPPAPVAEQRLASTEDEAWAVFCKEYLDDEARNNSWLKTIAEIKPKTPEDWNRVAQVAMLPF